GRELRLDELLHHREPHVLRPVEEHDDHHASRPLRRTGALQARDGAPRRLVVGLRRLEGELDAGLLDRLELDLDRVEVRQWGLLSGERVDDAVRDDHRPPLPTAAAKTPRPIASSSVTSISAFSSVSSSAIDTRHEIAARTYVTAEMTRRTAPTLRSL